MRSGGMLLVEDDDLTLRYVGGTRHGSGMVLSKYSIPREASLVYFEVKIYNQGDETPAVSVGIAQESIVNLESRLGDAEETLGWWAEDGRIHSGDSSHPLCVYGKDDIVGCIINMSEGIVSFTKNGMLLGMFIS